MSEVGLARLAVISYHSSPLEEPGSGDSGGMTVYVRDVAAQLATRNVATDIFTRAQFDVPPIHELTPGVRVISVPAGPRGDVPKHELNRHFGDFASTTRRMVSQWGLDYDLVHSHYWQSGLAGLELARVWGTPLVHSSHTLGRVKNGTLAPGDTAEAPDRLRGEDLVTAEADLVLASTSEEASDLERLYSADRERIRVVAPGVDHRLFVPGDRAEARRRLGIDQDEAVLLYAGRIQALKGLELAIMAAAELRPALDRPLRLVIVGGPSGQAGEAEVARLRLLAEALGVEQLVDWRGPQNHADLVHYYRAANATIMCSYSESFGLAALEAHATGIPVVATAVGGLRDIVDDGTTGWLIEGRDSSDFASALKVLLSDHALSERFGRAALERSRHFGWDVTADSLLELYELLVGEEFTNASICLPAPTDFFASS